MRKRRRSRRRRRQCVREEGGGVRGGIGAIQPIQSSSKDLNKGRRGFHA